MTISALPLTSFTATLALSLLLPKPGSMQASLNRTRLAVFLLTFTAIVFRSEVAILLFCHIAYILLKQVARYGHLTHGITLLRSVIIPGGMAAVPVGLCMTIPIDTFFWQSPTYLWPEFSAFLSNICPSNDSLGASAWGTQPWHWYFSNALPRIMMKPFIYLALWLFAISTPATAEAALDLLLPNLAYIAIYSLLPHKETRFIFPVVPPLTLAGALSSSYTWTRRHRTWLYRIFSIPILLSTIISAILAHAILLPLSAVSYPGAHGLSALHNYTLSHNNSDTIRVHLDNLSTQTGITRFVQHAPPTKRGDINWIYDKSENATDRLDPFWWTQFDYAIMESPQLAIGSWDVLSTVRGLGQIRVLRPNEKREKAGVVTRGERLDIWQDAIDGVALEIYGPVGGQASVAARQLLREGYGVQWLLGPGWSWTRGWWVDVGWVPKLYVLKQHESLAKEELQRISTLDAEAG
jgi:alpha-1,6-mannosyltransferase